ncbi:MAG: glycerol-3-phosphate 1-O-acyltransferase PlsY [Acidobacteria bacterium]|nr:glycerol-3-phosphate 1-O-acyltransferase PlsY [Acidobacteriota bacterium]
MNAFVITAALSYLLGSIPFGYLLVRIFRGEDVRSSGSGNIGATNVARKSPALGVATLLLDAGKGIAAVVLTRILIAHPHQTLVLTTAAFFAVVGHMFPVWLKFRGGKGVATGFGSFVMIAPKSILCMLGIFVVVVAIFRYVSLGSVVATAPLPLLAWGLREAVEPGAILLMLAASSLIIWKHRQNIARIAAGTEPKLGARAR